jgi:hypothetical protein
VELEELKKAVYELTGKGIKLKDIEKDLGMPANSLSGMLSGTRPFASKWIPKLEAYVKLQQSIPELRKQTVADLVDRGIAITKVTADKKVQRIDPDSEEGRQIIAAAHKSPPKGLTKSEQIRWHRENTQTLE